ncbi:MAG: biopolymer transporter ExbD [Treponema sp.]|jgi:biopolymer transport protein ExbD|nr:biopolymer transporter ExbD [Treponema sp.]
MNLARKKRKAFDGLSASSDIAFLLIVYFAVIAGFSADKGFLIKLPGKDSAPLIQDQEPLRFELDAAGNILRRGEVITAAETEKFLRAALELRPNSAVLLTVSPGLSWQRVVSFVELARKLSVDSFSFALKKTPLDHEGGAEQ